MGAAQTLPERMRGRAGLKPVQGNLQTAQTAVIGGRQVTGPNVDLNGRNQECRNPERRVACGAHVDETRQINAVVDMDIAGALFADGG